MQGYTETISGQPYASLSQPPPLKAAARMVEDARRRSATISAWASTVRPGPPAPISPSRLNFTRGHHGYHRRPISALLRTSALSALYTATPTTTSGKGFLRGLSMRHSRNKSAAGVEDASSSKRKPAKEKSKYANERLQQVSTDLALAHAQFMGGGKIEHDMKQQAKAAGAMRENTGQAVSGAHDEALEYAGLLDCEEEGEVN
ncbi:hypothetical protein EIP86_007569 [Pleurotus ostreatoroseus]|nr:hypothetical protein EIP86_007569 [Pleurotus ostreatoroseus]